MLRVTWQATDLLSRVSMLASAGPFSQFGHVAIFSACSHGPQGMTSLHQWESQVSVSLLFFLGSNLVNNGTKRLSKDQTELLIVLVRERRYIYDVRGPGHMDATSISNAWRAIAEKMGLEELSKVSFPNLHIYDII